MAERNLKGTIFVILLEVKIQWKQKEGGEEE